MIGMPSSDRTANCNVDPYPYAGQALTWDHTLVFPSIQRFLCGSSGNLLDLGCGNGAILAEVCSNGWRLFGADFSRSAILHANARRIDAQFTLVDATADLTAVYEPASFDAIISVEVVEHLYDPRAFAANILKLLKPGGRVLLTTPYHGYLKNLAIALSGRFDRHVSPLWNGGHIKFWSRTTMTQLLTESGFTNVRFEGLGRIPYLWKSMVLTGEKRH
jgi:2-polyprenyl-6-hydroxyphenyl methylase/3-demethylubiquinone-9 3-methyltransferase